MARKKFRSFNSALLTSQIFLLGEARRRRGEVRLPLPILPIVLPTLVQKFWREIRLEGTRRVLRGRRARRVLSGRPGRGLRDGIRVRRGPGRPRGARSGGQLLPARLLRALGHLERGYRALVGLRRPGGPSGFVSRLWLLLLLLLLLRLLPPLP